jgi:exopolysaccharide biosynthesis predicted pyruvyltransferase EpsI
VTGEQLVPELQASLAATLAPLVAGFDRYAFVDFPRHSNVGDSAIWLGARVALDRAGLRPVYECDYWSYRPELLERASRDALIVINGGGNLGDLYGKHQALREAVIERFPDRPILQLPQTIHFADPRKRQRAQRIFDRHRRLTLLVRDAASLELAERWFSAPSQLTPDMAFALAGRLHRATPDQEAVWLLRRDRESSTGTTDFRAESVDWGPTDINGPTVMVTHHLVERLAPVARRSGSAGVGRLLGRAFDARAAAQLRQGVQLLSRGEVVVTDRLHGHILCLLLDIPHVVLDDRNSKIGTFRSAWTAGAGSVRTAASLAEAGDQVVALRDLVRDRVSA